MSELIQQNNNRASANWQLLASASALALVANMASQAKAEDADRPTVWIEAGAQLERLTNGQDSFAPPFVAELLQNPFTSPRDVQRPSRYSFGQEGRLSFAPEGSDWNFSAAIRYGRSNRHIQTHEETPRVESAEAIVSIPALGKYGTTAVSLPGNRFATTAFQMHESHMIVDFAAGKDVGLGVFGGHGTSSFAAGVRFAQFTSRSKVQLDADPDFHVEYKYITTFAGQPAFIKLPKAQWNLYGGKLEASRSFAGVGPSVSWDADAMLIGDPERSSVTFDWGLNGALLFGRQKRQGHHSTTAHHGIASQNTGALPTL